MSNQHVVVVHPAAGAPGAAPAAAAALPAAASLQRAFLFVPAARRIAGGQPPGPLDRILKILGVAMVDLQVDSDFYRVPVDHLAFAEQAVVASLNGGPPLDGQVCQVVAGAITAPYWQRELDCEEIAIYRALGVRTYGLRFKDTVYTVLAAHAAAAYAQLNAAPCAAAAAQLVAPVAPPLPVTLTLSTFYRGTPPAVDQALARVFGAEFERTLGRDGVNYWLLTTGQQPGLDDLKAQLGLRY